MTDQTSNREQLLYLAMQRVQEAIDMVRAATKDTSEEDVAESYTIPSLQAFVSSPSCQAGNLNALITDIRNSTPQDISDDELDEWMDDELDDFCMM